MAAINQSPSTDFTSTTLNGSINDSVTTITVNDASTINIPCYAVIDREDNNGVATPNQREVVKITGKATNDLTVTRGVNSSTKRSHNDSAKFEPTITVGFWDDFYDAYDADHNPADGTHDITKVAMLSGATVQTLANKILSGATIVSPNLGSIILSNPTIALGSLSSVVITSPIPRAWDGWIDANETWTYATASTITVPAGAAAKYAVGDRIKLTQTTAKYFIVTVVADTLLTVYGGTDYTVADAAISANYYSHCKSPVGFPVDPLKWTVSLYSTTLRQTGTPTTNTWYNAETLTIPIGSWRVFYSAALGARDNAAVVLITEATLSTANNSESDAQFTCTVYVDAGVGADASLSFSTSIGKEKHLLLAASTAYYLNYRVINPAANVDYVQIGLTEGTETYIKAVCSYL